MERPKWLSGWGRGKNLVQGSLIIDTPDIKVVEASFNERLAFLAVGSVPRPETLIHGKTNAETIGAKPGTNLEWRIFYDSTTLPDFMSIDKTMDFMAGLVALSSGDVSVYDRETICIASGKRPSKGNTPQLLDYEMAKKIEEARKKLA